MTRHDASLAAYASRRTVAAHLRIARSAVILLEPRIVNIGCKSIFYGIQVYIVAISCQLQARTVELFDLFEA
jgi:hypothetical protein